MPKKIEPETEDQKQNREMVEKIAGNIVKLAQAVQAFLGGPLKKKALIILLAHSSGQKKYAVEQVLKALETMDVDWLNK